MRAAIVCLVALLAAGPARAQEEAVDVKPALAAAEAWLAALDGGRYGESWDEATPALQQAIPREGWEKSMVAARAPLGGVVSRKLRSASFTRGGDSAGDYVVIEYETRFETRPLTVEVVTPVRARDGAWKISNYIIR
ncbi:MAG TPA: DUF4019 domain-containing protein [Usitatibacter sp.]|nr:DUF4019 domain-containing protein [Usitatibacter sp.]